MSEASGNGGGGQARLSENTGQTDAAGGLAAALRAWLFGCPAIDATKRFGVDYLGDEPTEYALITAPSPLKWRENILGERKLEDEQAQSFLFTSRACCGADVGQNLRNLAFCQAVMNWIMARNTERDLPDWEGGTVTGVTPTLTGAPMAYGAGAARYQIQISVSYRVGSWERRSGQI